MGELMAVNTSAVGVASVHILLEGSGTHQQHPLLSQPWGPRPDPCAVHTVIGREIMVCEFGRKETDSG